MKKCIPLLILLSCPLLVCSANDDPEPPGRGFSAKALKGKWTMVRRVINGREGKSPTFSYQFDGERYTYQSGTGKLTYGGKLEIDTKSKPAVLVMNRDNSTLTQRFAVKIEKGELFLASVPKGGQADFTGKTTLLMVLKREDKK